MLTVAILTLCFVCATVGYSLGWLQRDRQRKTQTQEIGELKSLLRTFAEEARRVARMEV